MAVLFMDISIGRGVKVGTSGFSLETADLPDVRQAFGAVLFKPTPNFLKIVNFQFTLNHLSAVGRLYPR
jgi:hypothetical protein